MELMYITNNPTIAIIGERCGVDRLWIDMEYMGKEERQPGNTVKSYHTLEDISNVKEVLSRSKLMTRVNPINDGSKDEIREAISRGSDIVMLPMWKTIDEVKRFVDYVDGKAIVNLLLETKEAWDILGQVVRLSGINEIHVGLNDLHLSLKRSFMFELLADGIVDDIANTLKANNIKFGFGGIGRIGGGTGLIPAELILAEHVRLKSEMVILSRSFCNTSLIHNIDDITDRFANGVQDLRMLEGEYSHYSQSELWNMHLQLKDRVNLVVEQIKEY